MGRDTASHFGTDLNGGTDAAGDRHFRQRDEQTAIGAIMASSDLAGFDQAAHEIAIAALGDEIDRRWRTLFPAVHFTEIDRGAEMAPGRTDEEDGLTCRL